MCMRFDENCFETEIEAMKSAKAGVGSPLNSVAWSVVLKMARRMADKIIIINVRNGKYGFSLFSEIKVNIINVGASPKLTTSDRESSSLPNSDFALRRRAVNPSRKSKIEAIKISIPAR